MSKTCIICGKSAGSGEHVFPASLGGRRTNKGIYCKTHDNGYSSLVRTIAEQLGFFNNKLGVLSDHTKTVKKVKAVETTSNKVVEMSSNSNSFTEPQTFSQNPIAQGKILNMGFPDQNSLQKWIKEQEDLGLEVRKIGQNKDCTYLLNTVHMKLQFGGPFGLGAVAYITQTFLAQEFPEIVRSGAVDDFIQYTQLQAQEAQKGIPQTTLLGDPPVWWDFDSTTNLPKHAFNFGHRVTVGVDSKDGLIYGRISFFSTFEFSMIFGTTTEKISSKSVTIDINPLEISPPNDIKKHEDFTSIARVTKPETKNQSLSNAIKNGEAEKKIKIFMSYLQTRERDQIVNEIEKTLKNLSNLSKDQRDNVIIKLVDDRKQLIWNLIVQAISMFKDEKISLSLHPILEKMIEPDSNSKNGLSDYATYNLSLAQNAMNEKMIEDFDNRLLDTQRIIDLWFDGVGLHLVSEVIFRKLFSV